MNWDRIQGTWKRAKSKAKEQWGRLRYDDFNVVAGRGIAGRPEGALRQAWHP